MTMTLKKYNVIIYFIILLNLVVNVVIAQEATETTSKENAVESCIKDTACISANDTLKLCNGLIKTPDKYIEENIRSGVYKVEDRGLAKCMCNQPYYDTLSKCLECFVNATGTEFKVSPVEEYKEQCEKVGTTFTQTIPQITSGIPPKYKWGLIGGIALAVLGLIGFAMFKRYKKKKLTEKISAEGGGNLSTSNDKYPPPQSPSVHFRYQYGEYAPPADTPYYPPPPGQDGQYPPPPPPPPQQHHGVQGEQYPPPPQQHEGGQGGQSDSYYDGRF